MLRPRIKRSLPFSTFADGRIHLGLCELRDDEERTIERLIDLMDGSRSPEAIASAISDATPDLDPASVADVIDQLIGLGLVEDALGEPPPELTERELDRYSRSAEYFALVDDQPRRSAYDVQARLKRSTVCVLGVGGTGSTVSLSLAMSGVGALHVADFDLIEESNLNRQLLYCEDDVGMPKVGRAVDRLARVNSNVRVTGEELQVTGAAEIARLMARCDVFVLCADRPVDLIQRWTNEAAIATGRTWYWALSRSLTTSVGGVVPGETACGECAEEYFRRERRKAGLLRSGSDLAVPRTAPAVTPMATLSASLCSFDVLHYLGGLRTQLLGVELNLAMNDFTRVNRIEFERLPDCSACGGLVRAAATGPRLAMGGRG